MSALPRLVVRTDQCFGVPPTVRGIGGAPLAPKKTKAPRTRGGKGKKRKEKRPRVKNAKKGGSRIPFEPSPPPSVASGESGGGPGGASARPAPDPEPASKPAEEKKRSRRDKKSDRERRRDRKDNAPKSAPETEEEFQNAPDDDADAGGDLAIAQDPQQQANDPDDQFQDWGSAIYLSNDDTMSLSSAQRIIFAIDSFLPLPLEHVRPHELLNYFSFATAPVGETDDFSVHAEIEPDPDQPGIFSLGMAVRGRPMTKEDRRNVQLSMVVDRSGSMSDEGRMNFLKHGLKRMTDELKRGDLIHLVLFDHDVCVPIENFVVGRDDSRTLQDAIDRLRPRGSTDLHAGLRAGYDIADKAHQPAYSNRVVMITDALANTGVTDQEMIGMIGKYYDTRRIRLSGVGVGRNFNDALLDRLTERGKGAYVFLGSPAEVDAVFGPRFVSLVETTALDVHFQLHLPPSLRMNVFYGEESSTVKEDVQAIHYFANTSQLFLSDLMARGQQLRPQDDVMLSIEYEDPETGDDMVEEYAFNLGEINEGGRNVRKGRLVMRFVDGLAWMASRSTPSAWGSRPGSWIDESAWEECEAGRKDIVRLSAGIEDDPEVKRIEGLWEKYCARYERPRRPVRRDAPADTWPSAAGKD